MQLLYLFWTFFKIGLFTIGGGYAMIPLIQRDVVANGWLSQQQLVDFIAVSESTPGPFAINIATFVGMKTYGVFGALMTTLGVILPSFIIILVIAKYFMTFRENRYVQAALAGLRPTAVTIGVSTFTTTSIDLQNIGAFFADGIDYKGLILFVILFALSRWKKLSPILIILSAGGLGLILYGLVPAF